MSYWQQGERGRDGGRGVEPGSGGAGGQGGGRWVDALASAIMDGLSPEDDWRVHVTDGDGDVIVERRVRFTAIGRLLWRFQAWRWGARYMVPYSVRCWIVEHACGRHMVEIGKGDER